METVLLSIVAATVAIPVVAARRPRPAGALRTLLWLFAVFCAAYLVLVIVGTPKVEA